MKDEPCAYCEKLASILTASKRWARKHIFTHEEWTMRGYSVKVEEEKAEYIWADESELEKRYPIATAFRKWIDE